jgi:diguanylate cyclase (GGDEF)-like protein/PAS domain S-box-containing protein
MFINGDFPAPAMPAPLLETATVLEQISDCFLAVDTEWRITHLNECGERALGRRREDLLGKRLWAEFPGLEDSAFGRAYHTAWQTQEMVSLEAFSNFSQRWFVCRAYPSATGLSIFFHDVTEARAARLRLEENEQRYRSLFEQNGDAVFMFDLDGRFLDANRACESVFGCAPADLLGKPFVSFVMPESQAAAWEKFRQVCGGAALQAELTLVHKNGHHVPVTVSGIPIRMGGAVVGVYGIAKDETQQKQAEAALLESEHWMRVIAEASPFALVISRWDDGRILYTNRHFRDLVGLGTEEEAQTHFCGEFYMHLSDRARLREKTAEQDEVYEWEGHFRRLDGTPFWSTGAIQRMVYKGETVLFGAYRDGTEQRRLLEEARDEADRDPLTGLWNHRAFHKRFADHAERTAAEGRSLAVVILDLDNFKFFNEAYGHAVGDDVLRRAAEFLRGACRLDDVLTRFGGDEFALLLPNVESEADAEAIAARLANELGGLSYEPPGYGMAVPVSLSLGVALFPDDAANRQEVVQIAHERLRHAKAGMVSDMEAQSLLMAMRNKVQGFSMLDALVTAVDNKDRYTRHHSEDVMRYSLQIARVLGMDEAALRTVAISALLHDVGKIGVPDAVLRKPGRLTDEEFEAVKLHPMMGVVIVAAVPGLEETLDAVHYHHERWDGGGYPFGLRGEETPLSARLMAVADAYSAMTTDRPYRKGMEPQKALGILEAGAGTQWDPRCVSAFLQTQ